MFLLVGKIHSYEGEYAVVKFPDGDDVKEFEVPVRQLLTGADKSQHFPDVGTDVLVGYSEQEQPFILGTYFTEVNGRPFSSRDKFGFKFSDGTEISYDKNSGTIKASGAIQNVTVDSVVAVNITAPTVNITGNLIVSGGVTAATVTAPTVAAGAVAATGAVTAGGVDLGSLTAQIKTKYNAHNHAGTVAGLSPAEMIV